MPRYPRSRSPRRKGPVTVEFALMAPVFLGSVLGVVECSRLFQSQNLLASAAREGARLAAMDRDGLTSENQTSNDKVIQDIRDFLDAAGLPGDQMDVSITHAETGDDFNLDDPDNDLELFRLRVEMPYASMHGQEPSPDDDRALAAEVVFRNGRSTIVN